MRITYRLHRIDRALRRADPHLAAMLAIFARLYAAEEIISEEQPGPGRLRRVLAWLAGLLITLGTWALRTAGAACAAVRGRFRGGPVRAGRRR